MALALREMSNIGADDRDKKREGGNTEICFNDLKENYSCNLLYITLRVNALINAMKGTLEAKLNEIYNKLQE